MLSLWSINPTVTLLRPSALTRMSTSPFIRPPFLQSHPSQGAIPSLCWMIWLSLFSLPLWHLRMEQIQSKRMQMEVWMGISVAFNSLVWMRFRILVSVLVNQMKWMESTHPSTRLLPRNCHNPSLYPQHIHTRVLHLEWVEAALQTKGKRSVFYIPLLTSIAFNLIDKRDYQMKARHSLVYWFPSVY